MFGVPDILMLCIIPLLIFASAFFSGSETALFSLTAHQRLQMSRDKSIAGQAISSLLHETRALLITLLLGNMVVNVLYFVMSTVLLIRWKEFAHPVVIAALTVVPLICLILFGEVLPKIVASRVSLTWSRFSGVPLLLIHRTLGPIRVVVNAGVITPLARVIAPKKSPESLSAEELGALLATSEKRGVIDDEEESMLQQVLELSQLRVREIMTPRIDVNAIDLTDGPEVLMKVIHDTRLSSIPAFEGDIDHIEGIIYTRQVLPAPPTDDTQLRGLVRQILFVPEQQRVDQLLTTFRKMGATVAVVVDEYGGTAGIATIEDIVEHMVGEIAGPYESTDQDMVESITPGHWRVSGLLPIHDWADAFDSKLANLTHHAGISTLGGIVMAKLGRVPRIGDVVDIANVRVEVETMLRSRIVTLLVEVETEKKPSGKTNEGGKP